MKEAAEFATTLHLSVKTLQFYSPEHPRSAEAVAHLDQICSVLLAQRSRVTMTVAKGVLLFDGEPATPMTAHMKALATELEKRHMGGVIFLKGITRRELLELVKMLALRPEHLKAAGGADHVLRSSEVVHVRLSHVRYEAVTEGEEVVWSKSIRRAQSVAESTAAAIPALLQKYLLSELKTHRASRPWKVKRRPIYRRCTRR